MENGHIISRNVVLSERIYLRRAALIYYFILFHFMLYSNILFFSAVKLVMKKNVKRYPTNTNTNTNSVV